MLTILDPNYLDQRAELIRRRERLQRRHPRERAVVGRFDSVSSATPREQLGRPPIGQADIPGGPAALPAVLPADIARVQQFEQVQRAAVLQRAADVGHTGMIDFRGSIDSD